MASADDETTVVYTNECGCLNGGTCVSVEPNICECLSAFEGPRCGSTYIDFSQAKDQSQTVSSELIVGISVAALMVTVMVVTGYAVWRKCTRLREKRRWVKWQESRSQSKATIEGFTIVEPTPDPTKSDSDSKFDFKLINSIRKGSVFSIKSEKACNNDRKPSSEDIHWIRTAPYGSVNRPGNHPDLGYSNSQPFNSVTPAYTSRALRVRALSLTEYPEKKPTEYFPAIEDV